MRKNRILLVALVMLALCTVIGLIVAFQKAPRQIRPEGFSIRAGMTRTEIETMLQAPVVNDVFSVTAGNPRRRFRFALSFDESEVLQHYNVTVEQDKSVFARLRQWLGLAPAPPGPPPAPRPAPATMTP